MSSPFPWNSRGSDNTLQERKKTFLELHNVGMNTLGPSTSCARPAGIRDLSTFFCSSFGSDAESAIRERESGKNIAIKSYRRVDVYRAPTSHHGRHGSSASAPCYSNDVMPPSRWSGSWGFIETISATNRFLLDKAFELSAEKAKPFLYCTVMYCTVLYCTVLYCRRKGLQ